MLFFVFIMHRLIRCVKQSYLHGINPAILTLPVSGKEVTLFPADANKKEAGENPASGFLGKLIIAQEPEKDIRDLRVKLTAFVGFDLFDDAFFRELVSVHAVGVHGV